MSNLLNSFQLILMRSPWLARIRLRRLRRRQSPRSLCQSRAKPEASLKQCSKTPSIEVKPLHLPVVCRTRFRRQVSVCHFTKELCPLVTLADNPLSIPRAPSFWSANGKRAYYRRKFVSNQGRVALTEMEIMKQGSREEVSVHWD